MSLQNAVLLRHLEGLEYEELLMLYNMYFDNVKHGRYSKTDLEKHIYNTFLLWQQCYELTSDEKYICKAECLLKNTIKKGDLI